MALLLGPSGYGKSVLLGQVAQAALEAGEIVVRLDLRELDNDVYSLIEDLAHSLQGRAPQVSADITAANETRPLSARQLAKHLAALERTTFLLDHAERLSAESEAWLVGFIRALPEQHRLLISSRQLDSVEVAYLVATQSLMVLGPEQLAFDEAEVAQLSTQAEATAVSDLTPLKGWPMGVALTVAGAYGHSAPDLIKAVLRSLPPTLQRALPQLAPYDTWTSYLPHSLGLDLPDDWLGQLILHRLPLLHHSVGAQPHDLVLNVLNEQLRQSPDLWTDSYREAAQRALTDERPIHALDLLLHANLINDALDMAEQVIPPLFRRSQFLVIRSILDRLPSEAVQASPSLARMYGISLMETEQLQAGMAILHTLAERPDTRMTVLPPLAHGLFLQARVDDAAQLLDEAWQHWNAYPAEQQVILLTMAGNVSRERGDSEGGLQKLLEATRLAEQHHLDYVMGVALIGLNVSYLRLARLDEAMMAVRQAHVIFEQLGMTARLPIPLLNAAILHGAADELTPANDLLQRALCIAEEAQVRTTTSIHFALGHLRMKEGKFDEAVTHLMQAVERARASSRPDRQYMAEALLSEALRAQFQHVEADRRLALAESLLEIHPQLAQSTMLVDLLKFHRGQRDLAMGNLAEARAWFEQVPTDLGELAEWAVRSRAYLAQIHAEEGTLAEAHIRDFMTLHSKIKSRRYLTPDLTMVRQALREAVRQGWYAGELQEYAFGRSDTRQRLSIRTLGKLSVSLDGKPLPLSGSNVTRAQELIALMALLPPATSQELQRTLIGEGKGDHRNALNTLRASLTKATGVNDAIVQDSTRRYVFSDDLDVRTDVDELRRAVRTNNLLQIRQLLSDGTDFLPGVNSVWAADLRDTEIPGVLYSAYGVLGKSALERRALPEALRHFEHMQLLAPTEDVLRTIVEIHRSMGNEPQLAHAERDIQLLFAR
ncbi:hypothetical protein K7W42_15115 [Deinococcus sp. HMF7604]|uniref:AAA family ATPase n=1 Tax=Deinococcus betulae TaxID=2873312 RepID=UPI001CCF5F36|nr:AAA family ATPase [Deinococcus betulae]MBZ9752184.1 hypothetical protein [Deinococcus betulae]